MSAFYSGGASSCLFSGSANNFPTSTVNYSACGWFQETVASTAVIRSLFNLGNSGPLQTHQVARLSNDDIQFSQVSGAVAEFSPSPTPADWVFVGWVSGPAGANSITVYTRDNSSSVFLTPVQLAGIAAFTASGVVVNQYGVSNSTPAGNGYNYLLFDGQMTAAQMLAQSLQVAPITGAGLTLRNWIRQDNGATAGTDFSGNGFNMTISGTVTDGATNPTFPTTSAAALLLANSAGF